MTNDLKGSDSEYEESLGRLEKIENPETLPEEDL